MGDGIAAASGGWTFGSATPAAFDSHVVRSIPLYRETHELVLELAEAVVRQGGRCYDLGCSTGALTVQLAERLAPRGATVIGIDREPGMVTRATARAGGVATFEVGDLESVELEPASLLVALYTLQFVPVAARLRVARRLHDALEPGGALVLFEKIRGASGREEGLFGDLYRDWKRRQGFEDAEISAKAQSLRGVLDAQTSAENAAMLRRAGFDELQVVFRWLCWEGVLARRALPAGR